jgi:biotin carboxyl carrier protein
MSRYTIEIDGTEYKVEILEDAGSEARVVVDDEELTLSVTAEEGSPGPQVRLSSPVPPAQPSAASAQTPIALSGAHGEVRAPLPARVTQVLAKPGDSVEQGQLLLKIEAMKMENHVLSPIAGTVEKVCVAEGQEVDGGELLVEVSPG